MPQDRSWGGVKMGSCRWAGSKRGGPYGGLEGRGLPEYNVWFAKNFIVVFARDIYVNVRFAKNLYIYICFLWVLVFSGWRVEGFVWNKCIKKAQENLG